MRIGCVFLKNFDTTSWHELLHKLGPFCTEFRKATIRSRMPPNSTNAPKRQFRDTWGGSGVFVVKNSDATPSTNFCTRSAHFAPNFVRQPNGPECTQWYETHQSMSLGANGVDRVRSLRKNPMRLCRTNFCTSSARFAPSFVRQPNGPECTKTSV